MLCFGHALEQVGDNLLTLGGELLAEAIRLVDSIEQPAMVTGRCGRELLDRLEQLAFAFEQRRRLEDFVEIGNCRFDGRREFDATLSTILLRHRIVRIASQTRFPQAGTAAAAEPPVGTGRLTAFCTTSADRCHASWRLG